MLMVFTSGDGGGGERWGRIGRKRAPPPPIQDDDLRSERERVPSSVMGGWSTYGRSKNPFRL
jgi:hypothetical protein